MLTRVGHLAANRTLETAQSREGGEAQARAAAIFQFIPLEKEDARSRDI